MRDGSDAVSDWPLLNALLNTACGRDLGVAPSWRRRRHGLFAACRHGDRRRRHARTRRGGWSACCGTIPATGVMRHADAGYEIAIDCAREQGLDLPMRRAGDQPSIGDERLTLAELRALV